MRGLTLWASAGIGCVLGWAWWTSGVLPANAGPIPPVPGGPPVSGGLTVLRPFDPPEVAWDAGHRGVDVAAPVGAPILATGPGRVSFAGPVAGRGVVVIDHGPVRTTYEPVTAALTTGAEVSTGDVVGRLTLGAHCIQPCLHWGVRAGETYLDPLASASPGMRPTHAVRLVPAAQRAIAEEAAAERTRAARATRAALTGAGSSAMGSDRVSRPGLTRPVNGTVTSPFGMRVHPVLGVWKLHDGMDLAAACGTPIKAPLPGRVRAAYFNPGYGNRLILDGVLQGARISVGFNHAARYVVAAGQQVRGGQVIGFVGSTGYSTGCHLHLMLWAGGRLVDPAVWFP